MTPALQLLIGTRALLADPAKWTRQRYARNAQGLGCAEWTPGATCFCLFGAASRIASETAGPFGSEAYHKIIEDAGRLIPWPRHDGETMAWERFNDVAAKDHGDVIALLDAAIAKAQAAA